MQQAEEASGVFERLGYPAQQAYCLVSLAWLLLRKEQLDAAEESAFHAIDLLPEEGERRRVYECRRVLGQIYRSKGEMEKATHQFEITLGIASALNRAEDLFWVHSDLAEMFTEQDRFSDAQTHLEHMKTFASNNAYLLARASSQQAELWYKQDMFVEARSEALVALDAFEKLGSAHDAEFDRWLLKQIDARWPGQLDHF